LATRYLNSPPGFVDLTQAVTVTAEDGSSELLSGTSTRELPLKLSADPK
jgi:hypothetical protein